MPRNKTRKFDRLQIKSDSGQQAESSKKIDQDKQKDNFLKEKIYKITDKPESSQLSNHSPEELGQIQRKKETIEALKAEYLELQNAIDEFNKISQEISMEKFTKQNSTLIGDSNVKKIKTRNSNEKDDFTKIKELVNKQIKIIESLKSSELISEHINTVNDQLNFIKSEIKIISDLRNMVEDDIENTFRPLKSRFLLLFATKGVNTAPNLEISWKCSISNIPEYYQTFNHLLANSELRASEKEKKLKEINTFFNDDPNIKQFKEISEEILLIHKAKITVYSWEYINKVFDKHKKIFLDVDLKNTEAVRCAYRQILEDSRVQHAKMYIPNLEFQECEPVWKIFKDTYMNQLKNSNGGKKVKKSITLQKANEVLESLQSNTLRQAEKYLQENKNLDKQQIEFNKG